MDILIEFYLVKHNLQVWCQGPIDLTEDKFWEETEAAMSIEVGEHIPAELESKFLNNLVNSARRMVVLTWAVPGQGGEGHVNGQTAEAIVEKMKIREGVNNKYLWALRMPIEQFSNIWHFSSSCTKIV